jgi:RNA polymerase sigma-70 factor (ECF subfamily)
LLTLFHRNIKNLSDKELVEKYRSTKDLLFLGELYSCYMHLVYGVCLKYLTNREESKDAVMQVFENLITEVLNHEIRQFKSWLYVLTKNYCLMQIRSKQSRDKRIKIWTKDQDIFMESEPENHLIDTDGEELNAALKDCIEGLKKEQKQCIELFYFNNKCYLDIAAHLNIDEKKVKSHLQNGKRNLKICLENKNVNER